MLVFFLIFVVSSANIVFGMEQEDKNKGVALLMKAYSQQNLAEQLYDRDKMCVNQNQQLARAGVKLQSKDEEIKSLQEKYHETNRVKERVVKENNDLKVQVRNKNSENKKLLSETTIVNGQIEILRKKIVELQNDTKLISENYEGAINNNKLLLQKIIKRDNVYRELEKDNQKLLFKNQELEKNNEDLLLENQEFKKGTFNSQSTTSKVDTNLKIKVCMTEEMKKRLIEEAKKPLNFEEAIDEQKNFHLSMIEAYLINDSSSMMQNNRYVEKALVKAYRYLFGDKN